MKTLIAGNGEVGKSLFNVLSKRYSVDIIDVGESCTGDFEILHICFPFSPCFVESVMKYSKEYTPKYTVIHSTVPQGISDMCGAYHSPVRGVHPDLEESLLTFVKYLSPKNDVLKTYFEEAGITISEVETTRNTEIAKILSTVYYGWNIMFEKAVHEYCKEHELDFDTVYTHWNNTYNEGYRAMGNSQVCRPVLDHVPGKIGGHCVIPNCRLTDLDCAADILLRDSQLVND